MVNPIARATLLSWWFVLTGLIAGGLPRLCDSFVAKSLTIPLAASAHPPVTFLGIFFAEESSSPPKGPSIKVIPSDGDESSIRAVAAFMVDAFWLNSPQQLIQASDGDNPVEVTVSDATRAVLVETQAADLADRYGERIGKRLLDSCLLTAVSENNPKDILGMVGIDVCLLDKSAEEIIAPDKAEAMLKNALSTLGPKQRRLYKDSSFEELVLELLPPQIHAVCCLSNLAVSPKARRQGIAYKLCEEAERIAAVEWGFDDMFLKVESENTAARFLYEEKLGYSKKYANSAAALRVDAEAGSFVETQAETLILAKHLD